MKWQYYACFQNTFTYFANFQAKHVKAKERLRHPTESTLWHWFKEILEAKVTYIGNKLYYLTPSALVKMKMTCFSCFKENKTWRLWPWWLLCAVQAPTLEQLRNPSRWSAETVIRNSIPRPRLTWSEVKRTEWENRKVIKHLKVSIKGNKGEMQTKWHWTLDLGRCHPTYEPRSQARTRLICLEKHISDLKYSQPYTDPWAPFMSQYQL